MTLRFLVVAAVVLSACGEAPSGAVADGPVAEIELDLTVGPQVLSPMDTPSLGIREVLPFPDGTFWVLDAVEKEFRIRRFSADGELLGPVGAPGFQPGEYVEPRSLERLPDGRVVLLDVALGTLFTVYGPQGEYLERVPHGQGTLWSSNVHTFVDTASRVWAFTRVGVLPPEDRLPPFFTVMRLDGTVVDTVHLPTFPTLEHRSLQVRQPFGVRTFRLPYEPEQFWAVDPGGRFVHMRGDRYELERFGPIAGDRESTDVFASRSPTPVQVAGAEREELHDTVTVQLSRVRFSEGIEVPDIAATKPPVRGFRYSSEGRLLVHVSLPSHREDGRWVEPNGWDIFDEEGRFRSRVVLPFNVEVYDMEGDHLWGVRTEASGAEFVVRYRVIWPAPRGLS